MNQYASVKAIILTLSLSFISTVFATQTNERPRFRESGFTVGILPPGPLNAITDVPGVLVGHTTLIHGDNIRTGITAILPHNGNLFKQKVPGAIFVGNAYGKLIGSTQVNELGEIETPILLTSTLNASRVADALLDYMLSYPGNEKVISINPLVAETNDGMLNDIRGRHVTRDDVINTLHNAKGGLVKEGSVGAGTGTIAFGFKRGIGTSSRQLPTLLGGYTIGVLVQTNFGGILSIVGVPVGQTLQHYYLKEQLESAKKDKTNLQDKADGSIIIVIATNAPLDSRNLKRLGARTMMGLARTGSAATNGSGDYVIAFSTAPELRITTSENPLREISILSNEAMSPLFLAAIEATEEAIYNSLFCATTITGQGYTAKALPLNQTIQILQKHGALKSTPSTINRSPR